MGVFVRAFRASDLYEFEPVEPIEVDELKEPETAKAIEDSNLAVTGIRNGRVYACGGVHPLGDEQGEIWLRLSKDAIEHPIDTYRWIKSGLKIIEETFGLRQLNAVIKCSYEKSRRLAEHLGFVSVRTMDNEILYSKLVRD